MTAQQEEEFNQLSIRAGLVFRPHSPIGTKELFSGRVKQIRKVLDVIFQQGQHAIIFGERGVGKTSLANVFSTFVPTQPPSHNLLSVRINCDATDDFSSVWKKVIEEMQLIEENNQIGFKPSSVQRTFGVEDFFSDPKAITPEEVRRALARICASTTLLPVIVIDEFDRLQHDVRKEFADLIKTLSDHGSESTVLLIGVGDSIEYLIHDHQSVSRAMAQVQMPRMDVHEIRGIINTGIASLAMTITEDALSQISLLAMGFPHYAHLLGLHSVREALDNNSKNLVKANVESAVKKAIEDAQHSIKTNYNKAIRSSRKDNLFADVLLACALSETNELGEFAAQDVRSQMKRVTGKEYEIPAYAQHLNEFSEIKRGKILIKTGEKRLFRYRFSDALMQPYVKMQGLILGKNI